jgi:hypothetical protein
VDIARARQRVTAAIGLVPTRESAGDSPVVRLAGGQRVRELGAVESALRQCGRTNEQLVLDEVRAVGEEC